MHYFVANGSEPFACLLYLFKAFDNINFSKLMDISTAREMPAQYIKLKTVIYSGQQFQAS